MNRPDAPGGRSSGRYHPRVVIFHRTPPAHSSSQTGSGRQRLAAASLIVAIAAFGAGGLGGDGAASARSTQDPAVTATSGAFGTDLVGATDAPVTTAPSAEKASPTTSGRSAEIDAENRRILAIVGALVAVALALVLLTIRYWRATRPVAADTRVSDESTDVEDENPEAEDENVAEVPPTVDRTGRRSRRAVAGADHATADDGWEPRATGEQPRIDPPTSGRTVRPSSQQRADALSGNGT